MAAPVTPMKGVAAAMSSAGKPKGYRVEDRLDFPHGVLMRGRRRDPLRLGSFDVNSASMVQNLVKVKIRGGDIADW
jgi:hypothetical protein